MTRGIVHYIDNLILLDSLEEESVDLIYIDPPFNTGKDQKRDYLSYKDKYEFMEFMEPRIEKSLEVLKPHGSMYVHMDYREVHNLRTLMDDHFGPDCFINEIIWAYDYGGKPKTRWPAKHDNILFYVKDRNNYTWNGEDVEREPYMAPGLVTPEKRERGKMPTDVWWHTIVPTNSYEKTGYPTQKPLGVLNRIITASSNVDDVVLDFFAGSGTTGMSAYQLERRFILCDDNPDAILVMQDRFRNMEVEFK